MARSSEEVMAAIRDFESEDGNWLGLEVLLDKLFETGVGREGIEAMLALLERNPTEDGAGVFWSIVHGLESLPDYEPALVESVRRAPAALSLVMIGRLLNAGAAEVGGIRLTSLLREVEDNEEIAPDIRGTAQGLLERHAT
ncbi:hypothetical protein [Paludisphaera sp.]|uniref:hypothetical protein n=1 Tax=Paludisphaera sp. TaxID=2017432 RepID=UPI00301E27ED